MEEAIQMIRWELLIPIIIIELVLIVIAMVDLIRNKDTNGPRWMWILIILLVNLFGPILYFLFGRKQ